MEQEQKRVSSEELRDWLGIRKTKCYEILSRNEPSSYNFGKLRQIRRSGVEWCLESLNLPEFEGAVT